MGECNGDGWVGEGEDGERLFNSLRIGYKQLH